MAHIVVSSGKIERDTDLWDYDDYMDVLNGGITSNICVTGGTLRVSSGGIANYTNITGGTVDIYSGAVAVSSFISGGGAFYIHSTGVASSITIRGGLLQVFSGGTATAITWTPCEGVVTIQDGATVTFTSKYLGVYYGSKGKLVSNTITMENKNIGYNNVMYVMDSGVVNNTTVGGGIYLSGGRLYVSRGGIANNTVLNSMGSMLIYSGGTANSTRISSKSELHVYSGGKAFDNVVSGVSAHINVYSGGRIDRSTLTNGYIEVFNGGIANDITVNSNGSINVRSGGTATAVNAASGVALGINLAQNTVIQGTYCGSSFNAQNGTISDMSLYSRAYMLVSSGCTANRTTVNEGATAYIYTGGTLSSATVNAGIIHVSSGGTAKDTLLESGGIMYVSSGANTNSTIVNTGAKLYILDNGSATAIKENGGYVYCADDIAFLSNTISGITVSAPMTVHKNTTATDIDITNYGMVYIEGGTASNTVVNSFGQMYIESGTVSNVTVKNYGSAWVSSGGSVDNAIVYGSMYVYSGGTATIAFNPWQGTVWGNSGANVTFLERDANIYCGGENAGFISKYTALSDTVISGISAVIYSGGTADNLTLAYDASVKVSGGVMRNTIIEDGDMYICSGGIASNTCIEDGYMYICSGGIASNARIIDGNINCEDGILKGTLEIGEYSYVYCYGSGIIDFTVADRKSSDSYLINDVSRVYNANFTITVNDNQSSGKYRLAQEAWEFSKPLTIGNGTIEFGTISVNGDDLIYNGVTYSLDEVDGDLTLTITGGAPATIQNDLDGNGLADTVLVHTKKGFSGAWLTTGDNKVIKWGNLGNVNDKVELVGMGNVKGTSTNGSDIIMKIGTTVAAWVTDGGKVKSYKELYTLKSNMNMLGIGDFDGDGVTDYLLRSTAGDLGYVTGDDNKWHYIKGLGKEWKIAAVGDLDGNGTDDVIVRHDAGFTGAYMIDTNGKITWSNLDTLKSDMTLVGTGDFNGDGVDDVLLQNKSNGWVGAWLVEDGRVDSFIGLCNNKNTIEQIADFNGDGIDDLRIRTDKGDIGVLYVKGADTTEWKYFQSVGKEWDTSFALIS